MLRVHARQEGEQVGVPAVRNRSVQELTQESSGFPLVAPNGNRRVFPDGTFSSGHEIWDGPRVTSSSTDFPALATLATPVAGRYVGEEVPATAGGPPRLGESKSRRLGVLDRIAIYGVSEFFVFGSLASGRHGPGSDVDLTIDLDPPRRGFSIWQESRLPWRRCSAARCTLLPPVFSRSRCPIRLRVRRSRSDGGLGRTEPVLRRPAESAQNMRLRNRLVLASSRMNFPSQGVECRRSGPLEILIPSRTLPAL